MSRRARRSARRRAFTLVELMVSLAAGLIVTIAVVGLARSATTTFYEEARLSTVEATVRSAAERLRQDLSRVGFMSTGNIKLARNDSPSVPFGQKISHVPGAVTPSRYGVLTDNLQGIKINVSDPAAQGGALSAINGLSPDSIELTGNYTTDDSYRGRMSGNNSVVLTVLKDPAVARLVAGSNPDQSVRNAFAPGTLSGGPLPPFIARVVDPRGCSHFVVISNAVGTALGVTLTFAAAATGSPVLLPTEDQSTCGASDQEEVTINPVQTVRWFLGATNPALAPNPTIEAATAKFDLYREIRAADGTSIPAPGGAQVVAEYAIDLKFGITVDDPAVGLVPPANHKTFDMDVPGPSIATWTQNASVTLNAGPAPQRVRSVRFRLATRAALPDRQEPLSLLPGKPYISRYCTETTTPCKKFARVRTIMSEVALINQAGMTY